MSAAADRLCLEWGAFPTPRVFRNAQAYLSFKGNRMSTNTPRLDGENERAERQETAKDARGVITDLAIRSGAMTDAGELSDEMFEFGVLIAQHCADIAVDSDGGSIAGERIRAAMADASTEQSDR